MILDGDEVWTERGMKEALAIINKNDPAIDFIDAPFYLCVGDIYHRTIKKGKMSRGSYPFTDFFYPRFLKITNGIHWFGDFDVDTLKTTSGELFCRLDGSNAIILRSKYWHMTQLNRSSTDGADYSSGGNRRTKRRLTYFIIGVKINETTPEVFGQDSAKFSLSWSGSFVNFLKLIMFKLKII